MVVFSKKNSAQLSGLLCLLCACSPLHALDTVPPESTSPCVIPDHSLSIAELIDIALKNNPSTKKVYWNAQRASATVGIAESAYYPHLDAGGTAVYDEHRRPSSNSTKYSATLSLNMLLYDCGKTTASVAATKKLLEAASWNVDWNIQQILVQVFDNTYKLLYAQEVYDATQISVQESEKMYETARELNRVGLKPVSDVYTTKAALSAAKMELSAKKQFVRESEAKLAITLGLQATTPIKIQPVDIKDAPKKEQLEQLIAYATVHRADLQEKQARYAAALFEVQKEEAAAWPKFSIFGHDEMDKTHHKSRDEVTHQSLRTESHSRQQSCGIKVEVPLFTGFELMYKKKAALAEANLSQTEITALQLDISREVAVASYSLDSAQEKLPFAQDNLENATKAYESTFDRYMAGKGEIAELYNAQQQVASSRIQYGTVKTQWLSAIANLAYAIGTIQ